jgi:hypothetical protein
MKKLIALALICVLSLASCSFDRDNEEPFFGKNVSFGEISIPEQGFLDKELGSSYSNGCVSFYADWVDEYGGYSNGGIYPSMLNDQFTTGVVNQYSTIVPENGYNHFGVVHYSDYNAKLGNNLAKFKLPMPTVVESIDIANSTYVFWAIKTGDDGVGLCNAYSKGDWFKVTFTGYDDYGNKTGSIEHYLADFRDDKTYIATGWETISLIGLGEYVSVVEITIDGTDRGDFGLNTPTYCCIDNIFYQHKY